MTFPWLRFALKDREQWKEEDSNAQAYRLSDVDGIRASFGDTRAASTPRGHVPRGFHWTRGGMEWWHRSGSLYFGLGQIRRLGQAHDRLLLQRVQ
jgi:hypothetical protein